jgi:NADH-quinone oxidoreductase subunit L
MDLTSPWLILLLPLCSAAIITLFTQRWPRVSAGISIAAVAGAFAVAASHLGAVLHGENVVLAGHFTWLAAGGHDFHYGYLIDGLSMVMLMVVTGVGGLIHVYATGYMKGDPGFSRFFAYMSLFMFSMLGIVLADNFFQIFIHWELVGVSSYLLIGFYYKKDSASAAANKAFLTNRVGDFGFMLGILMLYFATRSATAGAGAGDFRPAQGRARRAGSRGGLPWGRPLGADQRALPVDRRRAHIHGRHGQERAVPDARQAA